MNKLENYLLSTPDEELDIEKYLLKDNLNIISDFEGISNFLYSTNNQRFIGDFILASNKAIDYLKHNREHKQNYSANYYESFKMFAKESINIDLETFNKYFKCIHTISLDKNEMNCKAKIVNSIEELRLLNANDIDIINSFIKLCNSQIITYKDLWPNINEFEFTNNIEYEKCLNRFISSCNTSLNDILQFLAYIELDKSYNDVPLENKFIFPRTLSNGELYSGGIIVIIDPSYYFIKKWISNRYQISDKKIVFFITDKKIAQLLNSKLMFNSLFHFCEISELEKIIENPRNIPSFSLVFANHLSHGIDYEKVVSTLLERIADKHRLMLFTPDKSISKGSILYQTIQNNKIEKIDLLPRNIENSTSPQRKMLLYINYGYVEDNKLIEIKNYNLLKNNIRVISGNPFILNVDKKDFFDSPETIRQLFYQTDRELQMKTSKERHPANLYLVSKEIAIEYTLSGEGTKENPYRGSAYVLYPHHAKKKTRINKCYAEYKTLDEDKMFAWIENEFLYMLKKNKNGEIIDIRNIISEIYTKEYEGKAISFKTFVYIHPELDNEFPDYYKNLIKEINNAYLSEIPLNQISYDLLLTFVEIDFKKYSCTKRQLINILVTIFNTGIEHRNCIKNPASQILHDLRKESDGLDDIRSALTQKFFYLEQIDKILDYALKLINKNIDIGLGIAIILRLFLGDEGNIILGLKWKDICLDDNLPYVFYQRQISNDGTKYMPFSNAHLARKKPLVNFVCKILEKEKDRQLIEIANGNTKYLEECSVVCGNDYVIAGITRIYSPMKLNGSIRKLIKKVGLDEDLIYVPSNSGGTVETNLAYYTGDIFKSNYWHYLVKNNPDIKSGELFYLLGIKDQFDTDSNHYIDYLKHESQLKLMKLQPIFRRNDNDI